VKNDIAMNNKKTKQNNTKQKSDLIPTKNVFKKQLWVLALVSCLLYISSLSFDYALDDTLMITKNSLTQKGTDGLKDIFTSDAFRGFFGEEKSLVAGGRYRPLTHAMFAIEHEYFGDSPFLGHLINIISYSLLILLIFISLRKLFRKSQFIRYMWKLLLILKDEMKYFLLLVPLPHFGLA